MENNMTDTEITALAREYAEFTDMSPVDKKNISAICECFLKYTLRRYCLVEKSKITEEYKAAQKDQHSNDAIRFIEGRTVSAALVNIFPEIAKEVEE